MSYIVMRRGPEPGKTFLLDGERVTLGRGHTNDIVIDDNEVKREHLEFHQADGGYELRDVSRVKRTFINGQPVEGVWLLRSNCFIELGDSITLEYRVEDVGSIQEQTDSGQQFYLVVITTNQPEPVIYPINGQTISVGRSTANDIVIVEAELSRHHFRLTQVEEGYAIQDLNSTNGTLVNGEPVDNDPRPIHSTDLITIGTSVNIHVTTTPQKFTDSAPIDLANDLQHATDRINKRKTSKAEVSNVSEIMRPSLQPSEIGTGLDQKTLENQVLISYARDDWEKVVAPMVDRLYKADIDVWVDQYLMEGSADWLIATEQARLECWMLVVVVSPSAMKSDLVKKNWRHFHNREKPILLFISEAVERMPIGARKLARVQFNPGLPDIAFSQLVNEIKRLKA